MRILDIERYLGDNMRILEVCVDLDGGGIDRYLYNYCSRIKNIQFDFALVEQEKVGILEKPLRDLGCNIFYLPRLQSGLKKNYKALENILKNNKYDAVHVHLGAKSFNALRCAKKCGVQTRIVHAHIAGEPENRIICITRRIFSYFSKMYATDLAACGVEAAKWVWGEKAFAKGKVKIHSNAIDTKQFMFDSSARATYRKELKIEGKIVVGHVGRVCEQKNQIRLINIFEKMVQINPNAVLLIVGRDSLEGKCEKLARELGIMDYVRFLGVRDDVDKLLNAMDVFVFPSLYEGLPFTLVEAECNGIPIVYSDSVTDEIQINKNVLRLSLSETNEVWAQKAFEVYKLNRDDNSIGNITSRGFNIENEARVLEDYYTDLIREHSKCI